MARLPRIRRSSDSIYRGERAERRIKQLYRRWIDQLDPVVERRWVETDAGVTHLLVAGPEDAPPLVVLHGGNSINPVTLEWFLSLADSHRLYAPDIVGQPGFSAETRLSPLEDDYARWMGDVLDGLGLDRVAMVGASFGAGLILRVATYTPERIDRAGLIVPAGLGTTSRLTVARDLLWPVLRYMAIPTGDHLERAIQPLVTDDIDATDERLLEVITAVYDGVRIARQMPPKTTAEELDGFDAPVLIAAGTDDLLFPADVVIPHARSVCSSLEVVMRLEGERHLLSAGARANVRRYLRAFLTEE